MKNKAIVRYDLSSVKFGQEELMTFEEEIYSEDNLQKAIIVNSKEINFYITVSIEARGKGQLQLGNLHQRWSRKQFGKFVPWRKYFT